MIKALTDIEVVEKYLRRIGAEPRSMKAAVVRVHSGSYWKDLAVIKFTNGGDIICDSDAYLPTDEERCAVKAAWTGVQWPELQTIASLAKIPAILKGVARSDIYEFRNEHGEIVMLQARVERKGEKAYIPYTYWSDGEWRCCEPDGPLPIFGMDRVKDAAVIFIHEGAKAAKHAQWMADSETREAHDALINHPWGQHLKQAVHLGWIGGALSPGRTDWSAIKRLGVKRAYIVADNDEPGRAAVPEISRALNIPTFLVQFTSQFPASFDLADPFPKSMFAKVDGVKSYIGPSFRSCLQPVTWATDILLPREGEKGRPGHALRDSFKGLWTFVEELDSFVCTEMPEIIRSELVLNKSIAPFSDVQNTSRLILKTFNGKIMRIAYRPDEKGLIVTSRGSSAINLHVSPNIKAMLGDPGPWEKFLAYMFVHEKELHHVKRWLATLIAKPETRMSFALLLISEKQGIGKTTLGAHILAPLLGEWNVGFPGESQVQSDFNDWCARKRLVIINEIYTGHSWKSYNLLKSVITDRDITCNEKYMRPYMIENWCHVLACSNSMRALKMENDDRRWFYPELTEIPWSIKKFTEFRQWLDCGGLQIIQYWAENFGDYVSPGEHAPMTERKRDMIEGSRSEAQKECAALADAMRTCANPTALFMSDVIAWTRQHIQGRLFDSDYELRKAMIGGGIRPFEKRIRIGSRLEQIIINEPLYKLLHSDAVPDDVTNIEVVRSKIKKCAELMEVAL